MSRLMSGNRGPLARLAEADGVRRVFVRRNEPSEAAQRWMTAGLVALGVCALAAYYLAPDVKRYMKMRNM